MKVRTPLLMWTSQSSLLQVAHLFCRRRKRAQHLRFLPFFCCARVCSEFTVSGCKGESNSWCVSSICSRDDHFVSRLQPRHLNVATKPNENDLTMICFQTHICRKTVPNGSYILRFLFYIPIYLYQTYIETNNITDPLSAWVPILCNVFCLPIVIFYHLDCTTRSNLVLWRL